LSLFIRLLESKLLSEQRDQVTCEYYPLSHAAAYDDGTFVAMKSFIARRECSSGAGEAEFQIDEQCIRFTHIDNISGFAKLLTR